jgi:hypothetical protein
MQYIIRILHPDQTVQDLVVDERFQTKNDYLLMQCLEANQIDPNDILLSGGSLAFGRKVNNEFTPLHTLTKGMIG